MGSRNHTNQIKEVEMDYHFRNLVFEGGGVRGAAYVGALEEISVFKDGAEPLRHQIKDFL